MGHICTRILYFKNYSSEHQLIEIVYSTPSYIVSRISCMFHGGCWLLKILAVPVLPFSSLKTGCRAG